MLDTYRALSPRPIYYGSGALHFGDEPAEAAAALDGTVAAPLLHLGLIRASGRDAAGLLQGQLSNDVRQVTEQRAQLASLNSPKGRMLAVLHVLRRADAYYLVVERGILESVLRRLRMYVLRAQVVLEDATAEFAAFGLAGPQAIDALREAQLPAPALPMDCAPAAEQGVLRLHGHAPRFLLLTPAAQAAGLWQRLLAQARPAGTNAWKLLDLRAGLPTVYAETQDQFVPQMANLDQLGALSFDKGCYTGQEVVARVHYLGEIKRRLYRLRSSAEEAAPGTPVCDAERNGEIVGAVVDSARLPDGTRAVLAVLQRAHLSSGRLLLESLAGPALNLEE